MMVFVWPVRASSSRSKTLAGNVLRIECVACTSAILCFLLSRRPRGVFLRGPSSNVVPLLIRRSDSKSGRRAREAESSDGARLMIRGCVTKRELPVSSPMWLQSSDFFPIVIGLRCFIDTTFCLIQQHPSSTTVLCPAPETWTATITRCTHVALSSPEATSLGGGGEVWCNLDNIFCLFQNTLRHWGFLGQ